MRIVQFSRHELRESQAAIQELTTQIQELQERVNFVNGSREFQDVESICSGKLSHVPRQLAVAPSPCGMLSRDQSVRPGTCLVHWESFLAVHAHQSIHHRHLTKECFTLGI